MRIRYFLRSEGKRCLSFFVAYLLLLGVANSSLADSPPIDKPRIYEVKVFPADGLVPANDCATSLRRCNVSLNQFLSKVNASQWWADLRGAGYEGVRATFSKGVYRVSEPILIKWAPTSGGALEIVGDGAIISGGIPLSFASLGDHDARAYRALPKASLGKVLLASFPSQPVSSRAGIGFSLPVVPSSGELIYKGTPQPLAQWPNFGYAKIVALKGLAKDVSRDFQVQGREVSDWAEEQQLRAQAYWSKDWADQTFPVGVVKVQGVSFLRIDGLPFEGAVKDGQRVKIENAVADLDVEGEWVFDTDRRSLLWWPPQEFDGRDVEFSVAESLLLVRNSKDVSISGFSFENARGDGVVVENSSNVTLNHISVRNVGNRGVRISSGYKNGVKNSTIESTGQGGVSVDGGDRPSLKSSGHYVFKCEIRNFNRFVKTYRPGVQVSGVGVSVSENRIHDGTHSAIIFTGNDHLIEANEIFGVVTESADAGAIYGGRDYSARGTRIEKNYLHDIGGGYSQDVKGVYVDDLGSGVAIVGNVFFRVRKPIYLGGGRDNSVRFNVLIESSPSLHLDARGIEWQKRSASDPSGEFLKRLNSMPFQSPLWGGRYPHLSNVLDDEFGSPKYNEFCGNLVVGDMDLDVSNKALSGIRLAGNLFVGESQLLAGSVSKAIEAWDFRLKDNLISSSRCQ